MTTTITFASGDQITSAKLNEIVSGLTFDSGDVTGSTLTVVGGQLKVGTITASEMGADSVDTGSLVALAVTTAKIAAGAITSAKIDNLAVGESQLANSSVSLSKIATALFPTQTSMEAQNGTVFVTGAFAKYLPSAAKAYGEFNITNSSRTIKNNSINIASLTRIDATHTTVTLTTNMNSANYTVVASGITDGTEHLAIDVYDKAAGSFKIFHTTEGAARAINFTVFGTHA